MFGKFLADIVEGTLDAVDLTTSLVSDTIKSPIRIMNMAVEDPEIADDLLYDTKQTIEEIKSR